MSIMLLRLRAFGMIPIVYTERLTGMTQIMPTTNNDNNGDDDSTNHDSIQFSKC